MPELKLENSIVDDRYFVARLLGRGSYAEVFVAYDQLHNDEPVIIKALNVTLQGTPDAELEQTLIENFQNEAVALDKVRHPNIIRRLGHGTAADLEGTAFHYLVLEYMPGGDLLGLCRHHALALDEALLYFQQVCEALAFAHSRQVIHRDLKPQNLLLSADKKVIKIADFGVAKLTHDASDEITRVGTNVYAPPEHHPDAPDQPRERLTPSADIYSLAKTVYTVLTGRAPRRFSRQPISELPANLMAEDWGASLLALLKRATQDRAAERYRSVQEFWDDFARLKLGEAVVAETDDEATVVRRRLSGTSTIERAASQPSFQAITTGSREASRAQKARIVVNIPLPQKPAPAAPEPGSNGALAADALASADAARRSPYASVRDHVAQAGVIEPAEVKPQSADALRTRRMNERAAVERSFFDTLQAVVRSDWLRRAFIVLLFTALIGMVSAIYHYYAEKPVPGVFDNGSSLIGKDGVISGAVNVNLRSEPGIASQSLATLPANSRVRVLDERVNWVRVRVLSWAGGPPANAPDSGWVNKQFVNTD
ncbi:MAG: eukaryotic-like serine/threonine-protein kinase [Blastocatellia bacterium]